MDGRVPRRRQIHRNALLLADRQQRRVHETQLNRCTWIRPGACDRLYSTMMRSAHSTRLTKIAGVPNFAPQLLRSPSETPRARLQAPQAKMGMCLAAIFSSVSASGGHPTGSTELAVALRIR